MSKEKYLVTGAAGFIGSSLVRELVSKEEEVYSLVRPESNLWRLPEASNQHHIVKADLTDYGALEEEIVKIKPTHIFHLATYGVYRDQHDESLIVDVNVTGTLNLLKTAQDLDLAAFINTGSVYEYADLPGSRPENILGEPRSPYDSAKIESTRLATQFAKEHGLPICTLRLFTTYGPFEDMRRLVPKVITSFLNGEAPTVSSSPIRDFIYLEDVVSAYFLASTKAPKTGEVINVGSGYPTKVGELVEELVKIIEPRVTPQITDAFAPINDSQCWADISLAKTLLNWEPKFTLNQGLSRTVDWLKQNQDLYI